MKLFNLFFFIVIGFLCWGSWTVYERFFVLPGESEEDFVRLMNKKRNHILDACSKMDLDPRLLVSVLYAERRSNINMLDDYEDMFAYLGNNTSIGLGQIRLDTAKWILEKATDSTHVYGLPAKCRTFIPKAVGRYQLQSLLQSDSTNVLLTAIHLKQILLRWERAGYPLDNRPDIVATLYTYGLYDRETGQELAPHANPVSNTLGMLASRFYTSNTLINLFKQRSML